MADLTPYLAAQAADPSDPSAMLILADHLEESGDTAGAMVLRGLAGAGFHSLHALAVEAALVQDYQNYARHLARRGNWEGAGAEDMHGLGEGWDAEGDGRADNILGWEGSEPEGNSVEG